MYRTMGSNNFWRGICTFTKLFFSRDNCLFFILYMIVLWIYRESKGEFKSECSFRNNFNPFCIKATPASAAQKQKVSYSFLRETFNGFGVITKPQNWKNYRFLWVYVRNQMNLFFKTGHSKMVWKIFWKVSMRS